MRVWSTLTPSLSMLISSGSTARVAPEGVMTSTLMSAGSACAGLMPGAMRSVGSKLGAERPSKDTGTADDTGASVLYLALLGMGIPWAWPDS